MPRAVNITASSYSATEQTTLTLSGTGLSVGTGAGDLKLTITTDENLLSASAGSTGVTVEYDPGYPTFGYYVDILGTATQINNFLAGTGGAYLRFNPNNDVPFELATLTLTVYDYDGSDYVESGTNSVPLNVTPVNDCPVIAGSIPLNFPSRLNDPTPSGDVGILVATLLINVVDVDNSNPGMAVTSLDTSHGAWYYKLTTTWVLITAAPSASASLLLPRTARLYFKPTTGFEGTVTNAIVFRGWDTTTGTAGSTANTTTNGGTTAFSATTDSADISMASVDVTLAIAVQSTTSYADGLYFDDIKTAYINLFSDSDFYSTYVDPMPNKRLLVSVFEFARGARQCFDWFLVDSQLAANGLADLIDLNLAPTLITDRINIGQLIEFAAELMDNSGYNSDYNVINFCSNGAELRETGTPTAIAAATTVLGSGSVDAINVISVAFDPFNVFAAICPVVNGVLNSSPSALHLDNYNNPVGQPGFANDGFSFGSGTYQTALAAKVFEETVGSRGTPPDPDPDPGDGVYIQPRIIGFTSLDRDIVIDGVTYKANTALDPTAIKQDSEAQANNFEAKGFITSDLISDVDIRAGKYNDAGIDLFIGNFITQAKTKTLQKGEWGEVQKDGLTFRATIHTNADKLSNPIREVLQEGCRYTGRLDSPKCGVNKFSFAITGTITGGIIGRAFNTDQTIATNRLRMFNWSSGGGYLIVLSGNNIGFSLDIDNVNESGVVTLLKLPPYAFQVGDKVQLIPGCDGTFYSCGLFSNTNNFGGIPTGGNFFPTGTDLRS